MGGRSQGAKSGSTPPREGIARAARPSAGEGRNCADGDGAPKPRDGGLMAWMAFFTIARRHLQLYHQDIFGSYQISGSYQTDPSIKDIEGGVCMVDDTSHQIHVFPLTTKLKRKSAAEWGGSGSNPTCGSLWGFRSNSPTVTNMEVEFTPCLLRSCRRPCGAIHGFHVDVFLRVTMLPA